MAVVRPALAFPFSMRMWAGQRPSSPIPGSAPRSLVRLLLGIVRLAAGDGCEETECRHHDRRGIAEIEVVHENDLAGKR